MPPCDHSECSFIRATSIQAMTQALRIKLLSRIQLKEPRQLLPKRTATLPARATLVGSAR